MKDKYLNQLKTTLLSFQASKQDIDDILNDYQQLYDDMLESGKTDDEVWQRLGDPSKVAYDLIDTLKVKKEKNIKQKIIAVMPFISLMTFFLLGFLENLWHPGWMVFLLIPITAILFSTRLKEGVVSLTPFIATLTFLILGFGFQLWHPGWMVFLIIPIVSILLYTNMRDVFVAISPFVSIIVFFILGHYGYWNPGWLVFLLTPIVGIFYKKNLVHIILYELSFAIAIIFYLYMFYYQGEWAIGLIGFILPLSLGFIFNDIEFRWERWRQKDRIKAVVNFSIVLFSVTIFLLLGLLFGAWAWAWQVFLLIPVFSILLWSKTFRLTPLMPFLAVILFFSLGYFLGLFYLSWLAFLLIPMVAILENA